MIGVWIAIAGAAWAGDLDVVRAQAVSQALDVLAAEARRAEAAGSRLGAVEQALPSVEAFAQITTGQGLTAFGFERPVAAQIGLGVQGTWRVIDVAAWLRASAAGRAVRQAEATLDWARVDARREATARYAIARGALDEVDALRAGAEEAEALAAQVIARVDAGLAPSVDAARATSDAAIARARVAEAEGRVAAACASLQALVGDEVTGACAPEPVTWGDAGQGAGLHPSLAAFEAALSAARGTAGAAGAALGPVVTASGTAAHYILPGDDVQGFGWNAGATLTVPLPGASSVGARHAASARTEAAEVALEAQRRALTAQRVVAERQLQAAQAALAAREAALEAATEARDRAVSLYDVGRVAITDVLDARRAWADAVQQRALAHAAVGVALADVEAARGVR